MLFMYFSCILCRYKVCLSRGCVIIHQITRNKRNVLAPRITHGLAGKRPIRSRNRICVTLTICGHVFMTHPRICLYEQIIHCDLYLSQGRILRKAHTKSSNHRWDNATFYPCFCHEISHTITNAHIRGKQGFFSQIDDF